MVERGESARRESSATRRALSAWLPVLAVEALVLFLSSRPHLHPPPLFPQVDKSAHFTEYALLGLLLARGLRLSGRRPAAAWLLSCLLVGALGGADELFQRSVPGRECSIFDWLADLLGGMSGAALLLWWQGRTRRTGTDQVPEGGGSGKSASIRAETGEVGR